MKRTLSSIAAAAMILGTLAPAAFAATSSTSYTDISGNFAATQIAQLTQDGFIHGFSDNTYRPNDPVTRGQFLAYYMKAVQSVTGIAPSANMQVYSDVAPGNWAFNFVGAAESNGWVNPYWVGARVGYAFHENYKASWGDAASFFVASMVQAGKLTLPKGVAPLAYVQTLGLLQGIPSTDVPSANKYMDRADAAMFLSNVLAWTQGQLLPQGAKVTVTGGANVAPGSSEQLNVVVKDANGNAITLPSNANVQWSVDNKDGFFNPNVSGQLVTTAAGTYNVTATVDGVASAPFAVTAYGSVAGVKLSAANANLVANGVSTDTVTATAVDASGNTVGGFNGTGTVTVSGTATTYPTTGQASDFTSTSSNGSTTYNVTFTNGVATFDVQAGTVAGLSSTYTVSYTPSGSTTALTGSATINTVPQTATALQVTPPSPAYVAANGVTASNFNVEVVDQTGNPMLTGSWAYNVAVSGPGTLVSPTTGVFSGNGSTTPTQGIVTVNSEQGVTGDITVTASATGLTSASGTVKSVVAQAPVKFAPSTTTATFAQGSAGTTVSVSPVDANGYPASWPSGTYTVFVTNSSNAAATNIDINGTPVTSSGLGLPAGGSMVFTDNNAGADAGTYTVMVKDSSGNVWATFPVVETAGAAAKLSASVPAQYVTQAGAASVPVTIQLQDANGNNVAQANVPVSVYVQGSNGAGTATLNGTSTASNSQLTVDTNSNGVATVTLDAQPYAGEVYTVTATPGSAAGMPLSSVSTNVTVQQAVVANVTTSLAASNGSSYVTAGGTVTGTVYLKDAYGNPVNNSQNVTLTVTGGLGTPKITGGSATLTGSASPYTVNVTNGWFSFSATAGTAGAATVTAADTSFAPNVSGSGSVTVLSGPANAGYAFFNAAGQEITSSNELAVTANTPVEVWLKPIDVAGNPGVNSDAGTAIFADGSNGQFRVNSSTGTSSQTTPVVAGTAAIPVWYVNSTSGSYNLSAQGAVVTTPFAAVKGQTNQYAATLALSNNGVLDAAAVLNDNLLTVTGYTYTNGTPTAGQFTVTGTAGNYTITLYTNAALTAQPTVSYNGAF